jgi:hypothetical protein
VQNYQQGGFPSPARRHFLGISAAVAGRIAAGSAALSLPILSSTSKPAKTEDRDRRHDDYHDDRHYDRDDDHHCFLTGTYIRTPRGEVRVKELTIGALVDTLSGPLPVKWIARQTFRKATSSWHGSVAPIRIARFALDDHYPSRDLYLSPKHCLFVDGFLIPVERLVNGNSVASANMDDRDVIEYPYRIGNPRNNLCRRRTC